MTEEEEEEQLQNWAYRMNLEYEPADGSDEHIEDKKEVIDGIKKVGNSTWIFNKSYVRVLFDVPDHIPDVQIDKYIMEKEGELKWIKTQILKHFSTLRRP